jgi:2-polyprenyl-3-methyl-5-hydroxy-6-metoxy-1,4-benzoquinol methylase
MATPKSHASQQPANKLPPANKPNTFRLVDSDCPSCRASSSLKVVHRFEDDRHFVVACTNCSVQTILPHPTSSDVSEFYTNYHNTRTPDEQMPFLIEKSVNLFERLRKEGHLPSDLRTVRYLEAGFGNGASVVAAAQLGMQTVGFDLDPNNVSDVARRLKDRDLHAHIQCGDINQLIKCETVDFIKASQIIEHLIDPVGFVSSTSRLLSPNGYLYMECPNNSATFLQVKNLLRKPFGRMRFYNSLSVSEHLWGFNRASMTELLHSCGYEIVFCRDYPVRHKYLQPQTYFWYPSLLSGVMQSLSQRRAYPLLKSLIGVFDLAASVTLAEGIGLATLARKRG